jgi:hypothetical protein
MGRIELAELSGVAASKGHSKLEMSADSASIRRA